jgi:hypothetical protein
MEHIQQPRIRRQSMWDPLDKVPARLGDSDVARLMGRDNMRQDQRFPGRILLEFTGSLVGGWGEGQDQDSRRAMGFGLIRFPRRLEIFDTDSI